MAEFASISFPTFFGSEDPMNNNLGSNSSSSNGGMFVPMQTDDCTDMSPNKSNDPPPPPPIVICPTEVDHINITLEKNQQCACKDCGKLFNSVWYLKQHAVKHSNDRPFKCKFCFKTYKFRSNLYQHKCPDRQKHLGQTRRGMMNLPNNTRRMETNQILKSRIEANMVADEMTTYQSSSMSDNEENDIPITYGLIIHRFEENSSVISQNYRAPPSPRPISPREKTIRPINCIREHQLPDHEIESYISENKSKLHTCRKCRLLFPTEASLMRHSAAHMKEDMYPFKCSNCRQSFESDRELRRHAQLHGVGPWKCEQCNGVFRSSPALRRHRDQCRSCHLPVEQNDMIVNVASPIDPFGFIPSESDQLYNGNNKKSPDSGVGSEGSPDRCHSSPERAQLPIEDLYDMCAGQKKEKDDDEDSGFRSRLNSVTQTCSPGSTFSSDEGSPHRKLSGSDVDCGLRSWDDMVSMNDKTFMGSMGCLMDELKTTSRPIKNVCLIVTTNCIKCYSNVDSIRGITDCTTGWCKNYVGGSGKLEQSCDLTGDCRTCGYDPYSNEV
ncbi:unnamed protein product [Auanema sp. JU1783]|nr:unnamed protein product [Auanema sp. JU1783]